MYRDGVSSSQFGSLIALEVENVRRVCKDEGGIELAYIVVNKRTSTRFFPQKSGGQLEGAQPGTFVFTDITSNKDKDPSQIRDFYLVSQISRQGAASPSHYHVLYSTEGFKLLELIEFTYRMCYLYFHLNAGIKVPAPIQYAERLGTMVGEKMNSNVRPPRRGETVDTEKEMFAKPGDRIMNKPSLYYI
jgi:aubergine